MTKEEFISLGGKQILIGQKYSEVIPFPTENTFSVKSQNGKEWIWMDGEVFYHSDGTDKFVKEYTGDFDNLKALINA